MKRYDYLIVGSGLFGATFAYKARRAGKSCLVIDKRPHLGGNVYCESIEGINVHKYDAHIFHTEQKLNKSADEAVRQIDFKNYPQRFALCGLPVVKVGINFDMDRRTIGGQED